MALVLRGNKGTWKELMVTQVKYDREDGAVSMRQL